MIKKVSFFKNVNWYYLRLCLLESEINFEERYLIFINNFSNKWWFWEHRTGRHRQNRS